MTFSAGSAWLGGIALLAGFGIGWAVRAFLARRSSASMRALEDELKRRDEELKDAQKLLAETSLTDALTGTHNRRFVDAAIGTLLAPARRPWREGDPPPEHVALILAEIDEFDRIDARGREIGDALLRDTARALQAVVRGGTVIARWTEIAFLVVARIRFAGEARSLAMRLRASVAESVRTPPGAAGRPVSLSIGFSIEPLSRAHPHLASFRDHLGLVEAALRRAQTQGGNRAVGWRANEDALDFAIAVSGEAGVAELLRTNPDGAEAEGLLSQTVERRDPS
ncbi:MAG TPA: GGDEF domain-containing protein [Thermoanaerobaculia bacterium]|nr:GGDEF domain-containing protein [Thermoanaerobaculia bacterium]